ncbi:hypothetical protein P5G51_003730 [Virgibacillus sp. 179-BFC.A HS]|uniref:Uncharacterized protein n=1 Tax=Tigheibacillus jepli TaxID=3035914 RepID=A0ABU5CGG3_9BACI|nr:hypothetical protein [Virgibacillus sp. 179-BFC.A HS]MDY0404635.1 hypothetical protein [Virgibacillus sp. 179-BFC.A HS]
MLRRGRAIDLISEVTKLDKQELEILKRKLYKFGVEQYAKRLFFLFGFQSKNTAAISL